jgi:hypothetical protein
VRLSILRIQGAAPVHRLAADLRISEGEVGLRLRTSLANALTLVNLLYAAPDWRARLRASVPFASDTSTLTSMGLDPAKMIRPHVGAWAEGEWLAPHDGGYAYFYVDTRGEVRLEGQAEHLGEVAFQLAAQRAYRALRLDEQVAALVPSPPL